AVPDRLSEAVRRRHPDRAQASRRVASSIDGMIGAPDIACRAPSRALSDWRRSENVRLPPFRHLDLAPTGRRRRATVRAEFFCAAATPAGTLAGVCDLTLGSTVDRNRGARTKAYYR